MRYLLPKLLVLAATALPIAAHADTLLDFTITGPSPSPIVTFTLPEHPFFLNTLHLIAVGTRTSASVNGVSGYTADLTFFTGIGSGSESLILDVFSFDPSLPPSGIDVTLSGAPLISPYFGADYPAPPGYFTALLRTGHIVLPEYIFSPTPPLYTIDITPEAATAPEPSTLILLLTGAGGLLAARRQTLREQ
jgi:hypothetical protein